MKYTHLQSSGNGGGAAKVHEMSIMVGLRKMVGLRWYLVL